VFWSRAFTIDGTPLSPANRIVTAPDRLASLAIVETRCGSSLAWQTISQEGNRAVGSRLALDSLGRALGTPVPLAQDYVFGGFNLVMAPRGSDVMIVRSANLPVTGLRIVVQTLDALGAPRSAPFEIAPYSGGYPIAMLPTDHGVRLVFSARTSPQLIPIECGP